MSKVSKQWHKGFKTTKKIITYDVVLLEKADVLVKSFKELKYAREYVQKNGDKFKEYGIKHIVNGQVIDRPMSLKDIDSGAIAPYGRFDLVDILFFKGVWKSKPIEY